MKYQLQYTSASDGVTLGVSGESFLECMNGMADEFGDGFGSLFQKAHDELRLVCESIEAAHEADVSDVFALQVEDVPAAGTEPAVVVPEAGPEPDSSESHRPDGADGDAGGEAPRCVVCTEEVTEDRAEASMLMRNEIRCADCTA